MSKKHIKKNLCKVKDRYKKSEMDVIPLYIDNVQVDAQDRIKVLSKLKTKDIQLIDIYTANEPLIESNNRQIRQKQVIIFSQVPFSVRIYTSKR